MRSRRGRASRGLDRLIGPFGLGGSTGNGILVEGFEHTAAMNMMNWNPPYYARLLEGLGFTKHFELYSAHLDTATFRLPDRVRSVADHVVARGRFAVLRFSGKAELKKMAARIGEVYNAALASDPSHRDAYPLSEAELRAGDGRPHERGRSAADQGARLRRRRSWGSCSGFPTCPAPSSEATGGSDRSRSCASSATCRRTSDLIINGAGILPRFQRLGGNALLYAALEETARTRAFRSVDLVQVADTTSLMLSDIQTLGGKVWKVHRVYSRPVT